MICELDAQHDLWQHLRQRVHDKRRDDLRRRRKTNPTPAAEEIQLGEYIEMIEPQVRYAVLELNRKGYSTCSSGFLEGRPEFQVIDGDFNFIMDTETIDKLESVGVSVEIGFHPLIPIRIKFQPKSPNLDEIADKWKSIADVFPDKGKPAPPRGKRSYFEGPIYAQWPDGEIM